MQRTEGGKEPIHKPFGDLLACGVENGRIGHKVTDIAHEQQAAPGQGERAPIRGGKAAIGV